MELLIKADTSLYNLFGISEKSMNTLKITKTKKKRKKKLTKFVCLSNYTDGQFKSI